jgi:hypothetical protein
MAPCVTPSSRAAEVKLRSRAAASKARKEFNGGRRRMSSRLSSRVLLVCRESQSYRSSLEFADQSRTLSHLFQSLKRCDAHLRAHAQRPSRLERERVCTLRKNCMRSMRALSPRLSVSLTSIRDKVASADRCAPIPTTDGGWGECVSFQKQDIGGAPCWGTSTRYWEIAS